MSMIEEWLESQPNIKRGIQWAILAVRTFPPPLCNLYKCIHVHVYIYIYIYNIYRERER